MRSNPTRLQRKDDDSWGCLNWGNDSLLQPEMIILLCGMPRYEYLSWDIFHFLMQVGKGQNNEAVDLSSHEKCLMTWNKGSRAHLGGDLTCICCGTKALGCPPCHFFHLGGIILLMLCSFF
jgi:hypothetical protein